MSYFKCCYRIKYMQVIIWVNKNLAPKSKILSGLIFLYCTNEWKHLFCLFSKIKIQKWKFMSTLPHWKKHFCVPKKLFIFKGISGPYFKSNWHFHPDYNLLVAEKEGNRCLLENSRNSLFENKWSSGQQGPNLPHLWRSEWNFILKKISKLTTSLFLVIIFWSHETLC